MLGAVQKDDSDADFCELHEATSHAGRSLFNPGLHAQKLRITAASS